MPEVRAVNAAKRRCEGRGMPAAVCARPRYETMLTALIAGLIHERTMPAGSIVDSGAFRGEWACYYAKQDRNRTVYAIEPDEANIAHIQRAYEYLPNLRPVHAALGANAVADVGAFRRLR